MEKITSWLWKEAPEAARSEDSYWYDDGKIIVVRGNARPEDSKEIMQAQDVLQSYAVRGREKLLNHSQIVYDFLVAKGFNV